MVGVAIVVRVAVMVGVGVVVRVAVMVGDAVSVGVRVRVMDGVAVMVAVGGVTQHGVRTLRIIASRKVGIFGPRKEVSVR